VRQFAHPVDAFAQADITTTGVDPELSQEQIKRLEQQLAELKARWPAHSVPPAMLEKLEELEEELERMKGRGNGRCQG